jgi:hypothetical protein
MLEHTLLYERHASEMGNQPRPATLIIAHALEHYNLFGFMANHNQICLAATIPGNIPMSALHRAIRTERLRRTVFHSIIQTPEKPPDAGISLVLQPPDLIISFS